MIQNMINLTPKVYFLDLEVDSVPMDKGEPLQCITQMAILDPSRTKGEHIFNAYINPPKELRRKEKNDYTSDIKAVERHAFKKVWPDAVNWVNEGLDGNRKAIIVMHNGFKHDWPILQNEVARSLIKTDKPIPKYWKPFDTLWLKNALKIGGDGSLTGICHTLGAKVRQAHDAAEDVKMTKAIFNKMIGDAPLDKVLVAALDKNPIKTVASVINSLAATELVVFDFESTGLFPREGEKGVNPRAVQLAGYIPKTDKIFNELINPTISIPKGASAIHGIYDKDVANAAPFNVVWLKFEQFIETNLGQTANSIAVLAGHNVWGYDIKLYESECERTGIRKRRWKSLDTLALARNLFKGVKGLPKRGFFKQEFLAPLLGHNVECAHDAKYDVLASYQLLTSMAKGVDEEKFKQAIILNHPVLTLGQLCRDMGGFNGQLYFEIYKTACDQAIPLAKLHFDGIKSEAFFEPTNLSCMLGIKVDSEDSELYTLWRIFLVLTKGVDRKAINEALQVKKPLHALVPLLQDKGTFESDKCLEKNKIACEVALKLAIELFPFVQDENFFKAENLFKLLKIKASENIGLADMKRLFLKLTAGVSEEVLEKAYSSMDPVAVLKNAILERGAFNPADYVKAEKEKKEEKKGLTIKEKDNSLNDYFSSDAKKSLKRDRNESGEVDTEVKLSLNKKQRL